MSAMSASPVKPPVLTPTGVSVPPPVATSPPKVGMMQIPPSLTIAPSKPPTMNHNAMPLSLIADHKLTPQYPPQAPMAVPNMSAMPPMPAMPPISQPMSQPIPRSLDKPKEMSMPVPAALLAKPTSNGMESLIHNPNPVSVAPPVVHETQTSAATAVLQKVDTHTTKEVPESTMKLVLPEKAKEPTAAEQAPPVEPKVEKKEEALTAKQAEPVNEAKEANTPAPNAEAQEAVKVQKNVAAPSTSIPTPAAGSLPAAATPSPTQAATAAPPPPTVAMSPAKQPAPPAEQPVPATVTPSVSRTEVSMPHSKPEMKVATIPRQATKRKREPKVAPETPEVKKEGKDDDRKSKRVRLPTQPYQSPIPELNIIAKITKSTKPTPSKAADDKLIVFYKNEFLAVRNAEGGFYVCQAMQNIYKSSPRIRIRWLSQEEGKDTYSPDFYDHTDFDCILTNLNLDKVEKEKFRLPQVEQQRTESILKRALDVEKGVAEKPPVTEEHPDGLDVSLFCDESQLKKSSKSKGTKSDESEHNSADDDNDDEEEDEKEDDEEKETKKEPTTKSSKRKKKTVKKKPASAEKKAATTTKPASGNKSTVQPAKKKTETRVASKRKSSVSSNSQQPPEKKAKKPEISSQPSDRTNKTRSTEVAAGTKSRRDRRAKSRK